MVLRQFFVAHRTSLFWCLIIIMFTLVTQISSLTEEVINSDESTFIIMGNELVDGYLPYVRQFDVKPPMMFFLLAGVIAMFGKSYVAIRIFGDILLIITAIITYFLAKKRTTPLAAGLGVLSFLSCCYAGFGQYTSVELPAMIFLMAALVLFISYPRSPWMIFWGGFFISLAVLTRTNLAYVAIAYGLYFLFLVVRKDRTYIGHLLAYIIGGIVPLAFFIIFYAASGHLNIFLISNINVPLAYAGEQFSLYYILGGNLNNLVTHIKLFPFAFISFLTASIMGMIASLILIKYDIFAKNSDAENNVKNHVNCDIMMWIMLVSVLSSVFSGGVSYAHYWLQFMPVMAVFSAIAINRYLSLGRMAFVVTLCAMVIAPIVTISQSLPKTIRILCEKDYLESHLIQKKAAMIIAQHRKQGDTLWAMEYHLIHWYLNMPFLSKIATHPTNLLLSPIVEPLADAGYSSDNELQKLLDQNPTFILASANKPIWDLLKNPQGRYYQQGVTIQKYISEHYRIIPTGNDVLIYQRIDEGQAHHIARDGG